LPLPVVPALPDVPAADPAVPGPAPPAPPPSPAAPVIPLAPLAPPPDPPDPLDPPRPAASTGMSSLLAHAQNANAPIASTASRRAEVTSHRHFGPAPAITAAWTVDAGSTVYGYVGVNAVPLPVVCPDVLVKTLLPVGEVRMPFWLTWNGALTPL
jgi:hypothetical protein